MTMRMSVPCPAMRPVYQSMRDHANDQCLEYGHTVINLVELQSNEEFDIILCLNVLEHILEYEKAIENLWNALKPGGLGIILVPAFYPLHDEPHDYWRFTEHSLRILLKRFKNINIIHSGIRQYPFAYFAAFNK